jgi:3-oxoadipate enol-lactonase
MQDELTRLHCPVLVIGDTFDRTRPAAVSQAVAKAMPDARYHEVRTGHYMAVQTPDLIFDCIASFLNAIDA